MDNLINPLTTKRISEIRKRNYRLANKLRDHFPESSDLSFPSVFSDLHSTKLKLQCNDVFITLLDIFLAYDDPYHLNITIHDMFDHYLRLRKRKYPFSHALFHRLIQINEIDKLNRTAIYKIKKNIF
jgi:hypothetical protein